MELSHLKIIMNKHYFAVLLILAFCLIQSGCVNGPVRHNTLGYEKYAAREFPKKTESRPLKVLAASGGAIVDTGILMGDMAVIPIVALGATSEEYKGYYIDSGDMFGGAIAGLSLVVFYPMYLVKVIGLESGFGTRQEFEHLFGQGSRRFE